MRNPNRLDSFYEEIKTIHKTYFPDWRFLQLIQNFLSWHFDTYKTDGFYVEEEKFINRLNQFVKEMKKGDIS